MPSGLDSNLLFGDLYPVDSILKYYLGPYAECVKPTQDIVALCPIDSICTYYFSPMPSGLDFLTYYFSLMPSMFVPHIILQSYAQQIQSACTLCLAFCQTGSILTYYFSLMASGFNPHFILHPRLSHQRKKVCSRLIVVLRTLVSQVTKALLNLDLMGALHFCSCARRD